MSTNRKPVTCAKCSEEIILDFPKDIDCIDISRKKFPTCPSTVADATEETEDNPEELNQVCISSGRNGQKKKFAHLKAYQGIDHSNSTAKFFRLQAFSEKDIDSVKN